MLLATAVKKFALIFSLNIYYDLRTFDDWTIVGLWIVVSDGDVGVDVAGVTTYRRRSPHLKVY